MNREGICSGKFHLIVPAFVLIVLVGLLIWMANQNYVRGGSSKIVGIVIHLRQIQAAKNEWIQENNITNWASSTRLLTPNDLSPYMLTQFTQQDFGDPICGEIYSIQPLNEPVQVQLTRNLREPSWPKSWTLPKGTIIKFGTNDDEQYFVPDPGSDYPKMLHRQWSILKK